MLQKCLFIFILVLYSSSAPGQIGVPKTDEDSTFIKKGVFIISTRSPNYLRYNWVFNFDDRKFRCYSTIHAGEHLPPLKNHDLKGLPQKWIRLVKYKDGYYPYVHENVNGEHEQINDSVRILYMMDSPEPIRLIDFKKLSWYHYAVYTGYKVDPQKLDIYIIDPVNKVAIFDAGNKEYRLMISAESARKFPLLVSWMPNCRSKFYAGDPINYNLFLSKWRAGINRPAHN